MVKPNGHLEIRNKKMGADVLFNGNELSVLEDGFSVNANVPGMTTVTMTIAVETILIQDRKD